MIILDMDGTLLNSERIISEKSKEILKELKKKGKTIVIETGRCLNKALEYLSEDFVDYLLANNGAIWYQMHDKILIKKDILNTTVCIDILKEYIERIEWISVMDTDLIRFDNINSAIDFIGCNEIIHLSIHLKDTDDSINFMEELKNKYNDVDIILMQDSFRDFKWVDIVAKDNNKGTNIKKFREYLNIDFDDTICFGDALSDIAMFKNVKTSVAMKNALPEVKEEATYITDTNDNDGIAKFLNEYFEIGKGE